MGIRDSFSKLKEKLELKSKGRKRKPDDTGSDIGGEGADPAGSLPPPVSHVVAGGHDRGGGRSNTDERPIHSRDKLLQSGNPESARDDRKEGGTDVSGEKVGQRHLNPRSDFEVAVGSELGREGDDTDGEKVERVHSSPLISYGGEPVGA